MNVQQILAAAREIYAGMNPYDDDGSQRRRAAELAVDAAGVSRQNRAFAADQVLKAWDRNAAAAAAAAKAAKAAHDALPEVIADRKAAAAKAAREAAEKTAREAASKAEAEATARRSAIGAEISRLSGGPSDWFFGTYSGRGEIVASPKGKPEIVVAVRVDITTGESAAEFGKYVAWGCPLESHTVSHWEATPDGERILAEWKARTARIEAAREKAAVLRAAREARERAAARAAMAAERTAREAARIATRQSRVEAAQPATANPPTQPTINGLTINGLGNAFAALGL